MLELTIIEPSDIASDLSKWLKINKEKIKSEILFKKGAVLFRGFDIHSAKEFNEVASSFLEKTQEYLNQSSPRTRIGENVYTSTEYPADRVIPQHSENSYTDQWPDFILFGSLITAESGGATPLADNCKVLKSIPDEIVEKFKKHGVAYVRHYHAGVDLDWRTVFQTQNHEDVNEFCRRHNITYEWNGPNQLMTSQICQATIVHPYAKKEIWFNQAHLFNFLSLPKFDQSILRSAFPSEKYPRNSYFGDGGEITENILNAIQKAYAENEFIFDWQRGDILLLDNYLVSHGRQSYTGNRRVIVAMGN